MIPSGISLYACAYRYVFVYVYEYVQISMHMYMYSPATRAALCVVGHDAQPAVNWRSMPSFFSRSSPAPHPA